MRRSPRALETRNAAPLTRRRDRLRESGSGFEKPCAGPLQAVSCCAVAKTRLRPEDLRRSQPSFGRGNVPSARPARKTSLFGRRPLEGRQRPKKPGPSLLQVASPVGRGSPVRLRLPVLTGAVDWPLVQIPADRHATTGTCVLGKGLFVRIEARRKGFLRRGLIILRCGHRSAEIWGRPRIGRRETPVFRRALRGEGQGEGTLSLIEDLAGSPASRNGGGTPPRGPRPSSPAGPRPGLSAPDRGSRSC